MNATEAIAAAAILAGAIASATNAGPVANPGRFTAAPPPVRAITAPKPDEYLLTITVVTGDDDLRSDSSAGLTFYETTHRQLAVCKLTSGEESWPNNSSHVAKCHTHLNSVDQLRNGYAQLWYYGDGGQASGHTYDNWNVDQVRVEALDLATNQQVCVLDAAGSPLTRMTGDYRVFEIDARHARC